MAQPTSSPGGSLERRVRNNHWCCFVRHGRSFQRRAPAPAMACLGRFGPRALARGHDGGETGTERPRRDQEPARPLSPDQLGKTCWPEQPESVRTVCAVSERWRQPMLAFARVVGPGRSTTAESTSTYTCGPLDGLPCSGIASWQWDWPGWLKRGNGWAGDCCATKKGLCNRGQRCNMDAEEEAKKKASHQLSFPWPRLHRPPR